MTALDPNELRLQVAREDFDIARGELIEACRTVTSVQPLGAIGVGNRKFGLSFANDPGRAFILAPDSLQAGARAQNFPGKVYLPRQDDNDSAPVMRALRRLSGAEESLLMTTGDLLKRGSLVIAKAGGTAHTGDVTPAVDRFLSKRMGDHARLAMRSPLVMPDGGQMAKASAEQRVEDTNIKSAGDRAQFRLAVLQSNYSHSRGELLTALEIATAGVDTKALGPFGIGPIKTAILFTRDPGPAFEPAARPVQEAAVERGVNGVPYVPRLESPEGFAVNQAMNRLSRNEFAFVLAVSDEIARGALLFARPQGAEPIVTPRVSAAVVGHAIQDMHSMLSRVDASTPLTDLPAVPRPPRPAELSARPTPFSMT